ncbi:hypothetical protein ABTW95_26555 [Spirillospora sp. NPDC127506]|jgi:hypothetical protein|uniref:hypothetical protein n=1 Tax=Actinomadura sp. TaxID=1989 RepID=UPI00334BC263
MRSRITGPLLVAAAVTAMAAPASADEAPPPAPQTYEEAPAPVPQSYTVDDCSKALGFLSSLLSGLPAGEDLTKAVCSMKEQQKPEDAQTGPVESTYTDPQGRTVKDNRLLGLPVEWPKSLTIKVPTFNDGTYTYTSRR